MKWLSKPEDYKKTAIICMIGTPTCKLLEKDKSLSYRWRCVTCEMGICYSCSPFYFLYSSKKGKLKCPDSEDHNIEIITD